MAYSCVRVLFEIGHEASIRTKRTPEGFTHDWEVFVRGADNTEINHFVDKVVFHLHETFPKPKRVVKDPPYSVKESGYAGFNLPIDICFRTEDEPKKVRFNYDLDLQPSGPTISKVQREKYVFRNPDEDLRRRLIRGGGVGVGSDSGNHPAPGDKPSSSPAIATATEETLSTKPSVPPLVGKPKLGGDPSKKHKIKEYRSEEPRVSNSFHDLFGPPIKTTKVSPDPKKPSSSPKVSPLPKPAKPPDKPNSDKQVGVTKPAKHTVQKDSRESSNSSKEDKKDRSSKDREKNKEKTKHQVSPPKRPPTPTKCPPVSKSTKEELKKTVIEEPRKDDSKSPAETGKIEKKKKDKKSKDEKPKKERHKEHDSKSSEKMEKSERPPKETKDKEKEATRKPEKDSSKESEKSKEREKVSSDGDKERSRHKHKKKERSKRDETGKEKEREREKGIKKGSSDKKTSETKDKDRNGVTSESNKKRPHSPSHSPSHPNLSPTKPSPSHDKVSTPPAAKDKSVKRPLTKMLDELDHDSSDSNLSQLSADDSIDFPTPRLSKPTPPSENNRKTETSNKSGVQSKSLVTASGSDQTVSKTEVAKTKPESANHERNSLTKVSSSKQKDRSASKKSKEKKEPSASKEDSGNKVDKDTSKKRKRKSSDKGKDENESGHVSGRVDGAAAPKLPKLDPESNRTDDPNDHVSSEVPSQVEVSSTAASTDEIQNEEIFAVPVVASSVNASTTSAQFSADYVSQLKDLQRKIMTLEDNAELQRVVQVIAETGQYEITKKTFDFDLCALDRSTVKRLQDFFSTS